MVPAFGNIEVFEVVSLRRYQCTQRVPGSHGLELVNIMLLLLFTRPLPRDGGMAEDHGAPVVNVIVKEVAPSKKVYHLKDVYRACKSSLF